MKHKIFHKLTDVSKIHHRASFSDVKKHTAPKESAFLKLAGERYSCRAFQDKDIDEALISKILEAARVAPTAANKQPVHVWVVRDETCRKTLGEATKYLFDAPVVFIVGCKADEAWVRKVDGKNGAEVDAAIVGTHIMLEIADLGLGTTWVGSFDPAKVLEAVPAMAGWEPVAIFPAGYPAGEPSVNHAQRKTLEDLVTRI